MPEGLEPRAGLPMVQNGSLLAPLRSHFPRALKIGLFRQSGTFGEAGLLHKLAFITCHSLPCLAASLGTSGTEALFKPSPVCTSWGLWSRVASLASLKGQRLCHHSPQAQQTFPFTKPWYQLLFGALLVAPLRVATGHSTLRGTKAYRDRSDTRKHTAESEGTSSAPTPSRSSIETEGQVLNIF